MSLRRYREAVSLVRLHPFDTSTPEGRSRERYRRIALNTFSSLAARGVGMLISLVTVPLLLSYLGKETFGLWSAITALVAWVVLFDLGIVNGLVNSLAEAHGRDNRQAARGYVATAFWVLGGVAALLVALAAVLVPLVPWTLVLAASGVVDGATVRWAVLAAAVPVIVGMPFSVVPQIYAAYQKTYVRNAFTVATSALTLAGLLVAVRFRASLPVLILVFAGTGPVVSAVNLAYLVGRELPWLSLHPALVSGSALRRLLDTSVPLFLFQIGALLVNQTQLLILAHRCDLSTVADYAIIMRLYLLFMSLIVLSTSAFVPSFREAFERGDRAWIRLGLRRMVSLRMALATAAAALMLGAGNWLLWVWLHRSDTRFRPVVWAALAVLMLTATWGSAFSDFLTIMDRIWIQVKLVILNGLVTVLLTFWLAPRYGVLGAIIATGFIATVVSSWLIPLMAARALRGH